MVQLQREDHPAGAAPLRDSSVSLWIVIATVVGLDVLTKAWAVASLAPRHMPHPVLGEYVRFTLAFNPGAAFGFHLGAGSRWIFAALSMMIVAALWQLYRNTIPSQKLLRFAIALVIGGAIGNLIDRIRSHDGVVDFIDIGVGDIRFWTFNVADTTVTLGAVLLVISLWRTEPPERSLSEA